MTSIWPPPKLGNKRKRSPEEREKLLARETQMARIRQSLLSKKSYGSKIFDLCVHRSLEASEGLECAFKAAFLFLVLHLEQTTEMSGNHAKWLQSDFIRDLTQRRELFPSDTYRHRYIPMVLSKWILQGSLSAQDLFISQLQRFHVYYSPEKAFKLDTEHSSIQNLCQERAHFIQFALFLKRLKRQNEYLDVRGTLILVHAFLI